MVISSIWIWIPLRIFSLQVNYRSTIPLQQLIITEHQVGRNFRHYLIQTYLAKAQCKGGPEPGPAQSLKCPVLGNPQISFLETLFQCLFVLIEEKKKILLYLLITKYPIPLKCFTLCIQLTCSHPTALCIHQAGTWHPWKKGHSSSKRVEFVQSFPLRKKVVTKHLAALLAWMRALCITWAIQHTI